jgi:hypothetical protein
MRYYVTFGGFDQRGKPAPVAIDQRSPEPFGLSDALAHACRLLSEGKPDVSIQDASGNSIDGDELAACCRGDRTLTAELRAV